MVVGSVQKGKNGVTDYADCYWVHKATGEHVNFETIDGKMIPVGALKLVES